MAHELLVALQTEGRRVARAVDHALLSVDEDAVLLDGDLLLKTHAVVLKVLQCVLGVVQLLHERIDGARDLIHLRHHTATSEGCGCVISSTVC